jgi:hypothetical protein
MILIYHLSRVHAAKHRFRDIELHEAHQCLQENEDVSHKAHPAVDGGEPGVVALVYFDDSETCEEAGDAEEIEDKVDVGPEDLLVRCVGWLKDEDCLGYQDEAGGVEKL